MTADRNELLRESLAALRHRIDAACRAAGREPGEVRMLAVTKTFPASDVAHLIDLGLRDFAENKDQEAGRKAAEVAKLRPETRVRWHMVGQLQRNKAKTVVRWADEVQSVDSPRLVTALGNAARTAREQGLRSRPLDVLIQVSLDADPTRGGCPVDNVPELANQLAREGDLWVRGLMMIAPLDIDADVAFARLQQLHADLRADHPELDELSAGMSNDLESAIAHGSTCVRVGTALLGGRGLASLQ